MIDGQSTKSDALLRYARWLGLAAASLNAVVAPIARLSRIFSDDTLSAIAWASAAILAILFLLLLFDRNSRQAISSINAEMQGGDPFRWRWIPLRDPTWGLFGSRFGSGYLVKLRVALLVEFVLALIAQGRERPQPLLIAAAAFAITIMVTLTQLKESHPSTSTAASPSAPRQL